MGRQGGLGEWLGEWLGVLLEDREIGWVPGEGCDAGVGRGVWSIVVVRSVGWRGYVQVVLS